MFIGKSKSVFIVLFLFFSILFSGMSSKIDAQVQKPKQENQIKNFSSSVSENLQIVKNRYSLPTIPYGAAKLRITAFPYILGN